MCGLAGAFYAQNKERTDRPIRRILELYDDQAGRGQKGYGAVMVQQGLETVLYRATQELSIGVDLRLHSFLYDEPIGCLFHHRLPTSTPNTIQQTHPIFVSNTSLKYDYYVIHNGVIYNDDKVKEGHDSFIYTTLQEDGKFNDSEACAIEFALACENKKHEIKTRGAQALAAVVMDKETNKAVKVVFGTNGQNPLNYEFEKGYLEFASELKGEKCKSDTLYIFDLATGSLKTRGLKFVAPYYYPSPSTHTSNFKHGWEHEYNDEHDLPTIFQPKKVPLIGSKEPTAAEIVASLEADPGEDPGTDPGIDPMYEKIIEHADEMESLLLDYAHDLEDIDHASNPQIVDEALVKARKILENMRSEAMIKHYHPSLSAVDKTKLALK